MYIEAFIIGMPGYLSAESCLFFKDNTQGISIRRTVKKYIKKNISIFQT